MVEDLYHAGLKTLGKLSKRHLLGVATWGQIRRLQGGEVLCHSGSPPREKAFLVLEGVVQLAASPLELQALPEPPACLDIGSLPLSGAPRSHLDPGSGWGERNNSAIWERACRDVYELMVSPFLPEGREVGRWCLEVPRGTCAHTALDRMLRPCA